MRAVFGAAALVVALAGAAAAFQRETTNDPSCDESPGVNCPHLGTPFVWTHFPVNVLVNPDRSGVAVDSTLSAVEAGLETWNRASGGRVDLVLAGTTSSGASGQDGQNVVVWQSVSDPDTFARAIITFETETGHIIDTDVQMATAFTWAVLPDGEDDPNDPRVDIQAVVTHEAGHVLGLDHENRFGPDVVMYFSDTTGNTEHRTLSDDDRDGLRTIYGSGGGGGGGGGCTIGEGGRRDELLPLALVLFALALRRQPWSRTARRES